MIDFRKFRPYCSGALFLFLAVSVLVLAQDKDKDKDDKDKPSKKTASASKLIKVEGKVRCDKADPAYSMEVPDRPGHALWLRKRHCSWTEPMEVLGAKSKDGVAIEFPEQMEGTQHAHGFEVDTYDNGEKLTWQSMGTVYGEKGPANCKGRWSLMRGTGKFKGIKGGGSYEGKLGADDVLTLEFEGVYDPSEIVEEKK
jgi:hypothetical protein